MIKATELKIKNIAHASFVCGSLYLVKFSSARGGWPRENYIEITIKMNKRLTYRSAMAAADVVVLC